MEIEKNNPKALNVAKLSGSLNKVTLGFKCNPKVKLHLIQESQSLGISLSEYVENLVLNSNDLKSQAIEEREALHSEVNSLTKRLAIYENDILKQMHQKYAGKEVEYQDNNGENKKLKIADLTHIYTIIINSFKIEK